MVSYAVEIKPSARKELEHLSDGLIGRMVPKIEGLAVNPRPSGCKKLRGYEDFWRIRIGNYRVVYIIDDEGRIVNVTALPTAETFTNN